ncbi:MULTISPECIES: hypothetical protein [Pseudomonas]|uniref:Uncharacterized protein n=1 Tax=Pseudomonas marincola TaxID=437900 RepID=A0A653E6I3_9PSED|nr:hypothetical protein [Pseudomonas marincola]CAE6906469.1 conserved protein of unknown function [Pseudomonas marincola]
MSVYRDAAHAIARIMAIETIDGTKKAAWQRQYEPGFAEEPPASNPCPLSDSERLTQDSMTRSRLHKELSPVLWAVLVAKYSINDIERAQAVHYLVPRVVTPAHHLFRMKAVTAWAIPQMRGQKGAKRSSGLPDSFYELSSWDADGTPESTLRRWRVAVNRWLESQVDDAFADVTRVLQGSNLILKAAA